MAQEFVVTVYFPPNGRDLMLARSFGDRASAFQYSEGAAQGKAALVTIQNRKGGIEGFFIGRDSLPLPAENGADVYLPIMTMQTAKA